MQTIRGAVMTAGIWRRRGTTCGLSALWTRRSYSATWHRRYWLHVAEKNMSAKTKELENLHISTGTFVSPSSAFPDYRDKGKCLLFFLGH